MPAKYLTPDSLSDLLSPTILSQLTSDDGSDTADTTIIDAAILDAEAEVDGYLATRYALPLLTPVPALVIKLSGDIAVYNIYRRRQLVPESVRQAYQDARSTLRDLSGRKLDLDLATDPSDPPPQATYFGANKRRFGEDWRDL